MLFSNFCGLLVLLFGSEPTSKASSVSSTVCSLVSRLFVTGFTVIRHHAHQISPHSHLPLCHRHPPPRIPAQPNLVPLRVVFLGLGYHQSKARVPFLAPPPDLCRASINAAFIFRAPLVSSSQFHPIGIFGSLHPFFPPSSFATAPPRHSSHLPFGRQVPISIPPHAHAHTRGISIRPAEPSLAPTSVYPPPPTRHSPPPLTHRLHHCSSQGLAQKRPSCCLRHHHHHPCDPLLHQNHIQWQQSSCRHRRDHHLKARRKRSSPPFIVIPTTALLRHPPLPFRPISNQQCPARRRRPRHRHSSSRRQRHRLCAMQAKEINGLTRNVASNATSKSRPSRRLPR